MDLYNQTSHQLSLVLTRAYSTSFSQSMKLFPKEMQLHIAAIYGLVRIADEIVDSYKGNDTEKILNDLENETYASIQRQYSSNPIVHAFATTAARHNIDQRLIQPFFYSMHMDLSPQNFDKKLYDLYIHGSAEVIGLMCLKIFTNDNSLYEQLKSGARHLGAAYQKVNFLRDIKNDASELKRWYFPYGSFNGFDEQLKQQIIADIRNDFNQALPAARRLPRSVQPAVILSIRYYTALLRQIEKTSANDLKNRRIRVSDIKKAALLARAKAKI